MVATESKPPKQLKVQSMPSLDIGPDELKTKQIADPTLRTYWELAEAPMRKLPLIGTSFSVICVDIGRISPPSEGYRYIQLPSTCVSDSQRQCHWLAYPTKCIRTEDHSSRLR